MVEVPWSRAQMRHHLALHRVRAVLGLLEQPQYSYPVERQVVSIWAGTNGYLDDVPLEDVGRFEREFLDFQRERSRIYELRFAKPAKLSDDTASALQGSR